MSALHKAVAHAIAHETLVEQSAAKRAADAAIGVVLAEATRSIEGALDEFFAETSWDMPYINEDGSVAGTTPLKGRRLATDKNLRPVLLAVLAALGDEA